MPRWYWWGLALGWVLVGLAADLGPPWMLIAATLVVGAVHAAVGQRVMSGRHRTDQLSVRADVAGRHVGVIVLGFLFAVVVLTIAVALLLDAGGASHPAIIAGTVAAFVVALGGPALMAALRRHAERSAGH